MEVENNEEKKEKKRKKGQKRRRKKVHVGEGYPWTAVSVTLTMTLMSPRMPCMVSKIGSHPLRTTPDVGAFVEVVSSRWHSNGFRSR